MNKIYQKTTKTTNILNHEYVNTKLFLIFIYYLFLEFYFQSYYNYKLQIFIFLFFYFLRFFVVM